MRVEQFALLRRNGSDLDVHVRCSSGTYVRALARDLGAALGVGARAAAGTAVNRDAEVFGGMAEPTADYAWQLAVEHFGARD